jgi:hypothetical protein
MTKKPLAQLEKIRKRIDKIKTELAAIEEMRPGSLTRQFKDAKAKTGPYYQVSYTRDMKSRTQYVPRDCVADLRRQIATYKRFKSLTEKWIDLSIEYSRLKMKLERTP